MSLTGSAVLVGPGPRVTQDSTWQDSGLCVPCPLGVGHGGRRGFGERGRDGESWGEMAKSGSSTYNRLSNPNVHTGLASNRRSEPATRQHFLRDYHLQTRSKQVLANGLANPPNPVGNTQGGRGGCPGHMASKWPMDNTAQEFKWQVRGLCVGRRWGGVETVANHRARACPEGQLDFAASVATRRGFGPRVAPSPETLSKISSLSRVDLRFTFFNKHREGHASHICWLVSVHSVTSDPWGETIILECCEHPPRT